MDYSNKSRETIKAEREAKKIAKAAAKKKEKIENKIHDESLKQTNKIDKHEIQEKSKTNINLEIETNKIDEKNKLGENKNENKQKIEEKSKVELRAERRAKQEAQRAAKQALLIDKTKPMKDITQKIQEKSTTLISKDKLLKTTYAKSEIKENLHEVNLFKHLYINKRDISEHINNNNLNLHPKILRLGVQYSEKVIVGSNARCVALLAALRELIVDFERPSQADFTRGLESSLQQSLKYLNLCRPSAVSMQNAVKHLKWQMSTLQSTTTDEEGKRILITAINTYIKEQILLAAKAISNAIQEKILPGNIILTYGFSSLIYKIFKDAINDGNSFKVIVVDGRPWLEGKELLRRLVKLNIDCSYVLINALSYIMPQVSKVFLGAHAILANGAVMSRAGTAQVALIANAFNVPVLVACETHKSCERVQTDSIVYNELGDPNQLINTFGSSIKSCLSNWTTRKTLNLLNITYDVTPANLVTAVVTELAILPCTSVPVILRIKPSEI